MKSFEKVMVPVPVPTFQKLRFQFRFQLHIYTIKSKFFLKNLFPFYIVSCFTRKKILNINKFIVKIERKIFNEGNQIHNFISSSGSGTVINYGSGSDFLTRTGSGSTRQKVTVPTVPVPVPQHWDPQPLARHFRGGGGGLGCLSRAFPHTGKYSFFASFSLIT
jgi:hypothetical protein